MKKILVTGAGSYIGDTFVRYVKENFTEYEIHTVDMIDGTWRQQDFSCYDSVFHVAGIAHRKETKENAELYYKVNCDLAVETAQKAKAEGVRQFVFLSTMSVYGLETGAITAQTPLTPKSHYGISKLQAEAQIRALEEETFRVAVLRPPMVYGKDCKGNFQTVVKLAGKLPLFPKIKNQRSMIHVDNLCACVAWLIGNDASGLFLPQDPGYMNTTDMAGYIAKGLGKKLFMSRLLGFGVWVLRPFSKTVQKAFGSLTYAREETPWPIPRTSQEEAVKDSV